jgi:hypothetical protein
MSHSTTPPGLDNLLGLFHAELASVQFPGVDAKVLDAAVERVEAAARELRQREAELDAARAQLVAAQEDALQKGQRALAYARIFAQDTPELLARLDGVALGGVATSAPSASSLSTAPAAPRRRGRPPKSASASSLFAGGGESAPTTDELAGMEPPVRIVLEAEAT